MKIISGSFAVKRLEFILKCHLTLSWTRKFHDSNHGLYRLSLRMFPFFFLGKIITSHRSFYIYYTFSYPRLLYKAEQVIMSFFKMRKLTTSKILRQHTQSHKTKWWGQELRIQNSYQVLRLPRTPELLFLWDFHLIQSTFDL